MSLAAMDRRLLRRPALDALARSAVRFDRAYTTMALCSPARTSLMTGLYPHGHRVISNAHGAGTVVWEVAPQHQTWSEILAATGYRLGIAGR